MSKLLFIGSTVADVIVRVPHLPVTAEDLHVTGQQVALGGCAYNAFHAAMLMNKADCTLLSPVGSGVWGDFVTAQLAKAGVVSAVPRVEEPNGCCYCLVEDSGERTFLSHHGAEYRFQKAWVTDCRPEQFDYAYLCGLEVEEQTGTAILEALEEHPPKHLVFAPGPRIVRLAQEKLDRLHALHPIYHLNEEEALAYAKAETVEEAAAFIQRQTNAEVLITLGADGCYALAEDFVGRVAGVKAQVTDTIGAGDAHVGAWMALRSSGASTEEAIAWANRMASAVVSVAGAGLTEAQYQQKVLGQQG